MSTENTQNLDGGMNEELKEALDDLRSAFAVGENRQLTSSAAFWDSLTQEQQMMAFDQVVRRISDGELNKKGSYRYILYDVFGWGPEAYGMGMNCGFMDLHNAIGDKCPHCGKWPDDK